MRYNMSFYDKYDDEDYIRVKREQYEEQEMLEWEFEESEIEDEK